MKEPRPQKYFAKPSEARERAGTRISGCWCHFLPPQCSPGDGAGPQNMKRNAIWEPCGFELPMNAVSWNWDQGQVHLFQEGDRYSPGSACGALHRPQCLCMYFSVSSTPPTLLPVARQITSCDKSFLTTTFGDWVSYSTSHSTLC